jgi:hypothetical protein
MAAAIDLRSDFDGDGLRRIAQASKDGRQVRRLLALAAIYDGGTRSEAARVGNVGLQIVRNRVVRWRLTDLAQWIWDEFRLSTSKQTLSRELRGSGYRKLSARPRHHTPEADAIPAKKNFSIQLAAIRTALPRGTPIEIW